MLIESVAIDTLIPDPANARRHDQKNLDAIKGSLQKFGQQKNIVVRNNIVLAGNGTLEAAKALGWTHVTVKRADDLSSVDAAAFALADNRSAELASWDMETLGTALHSLREEGFDLTDIGFDTSDLDEYLSKEDQTTLDDSEYSTKIETPIYTPKGEKPALVELCDQTKAKELISNIEKSELSDDVKSFLTLAAQRHNVFNYELIAEYYAHASKDLQELMENSALVIIDFKKAIENGFVVMSKYIAEMHDEEYEEVEE